MMELFLYENLDQSSVLIAAKERKRPAADDATTPSTASFEPDKLALEDELDDILFDEETEETEELEEVAPQPLDEQVGS